METARSERLVAGRSPTFQHTPSVAHDALLSAVLDSLPLVLFELDPAGIILRSAGQATPGVRHLTKPVGLDGSSVGYSAFDLYADYPDVLAATTRALAGEAFTETLELGVRVFEVSYTPRFHPDGSVASVIGVGLDITTRMRAQQGAFAALAELTEANAQFRQLALRFDAACEAERVQAAREIHDELGQTLTALSLDAAWVSRRVTEAVSQESAPEAAVLERLREMAQVSEQATATARRIAQKLRPAALDRLGLVAACREESAAFERRTGLTVDFSGMESVPRLPEAIETAAFRIFQEALTNVARHARATCVGTGVWVDASRVTIWVGDDGRGFDSLAPRHSLGLLGMRERASEHGGTLAVSTAPGKGATISASFPLEAPTSRAMSRRGPAESSGM